MRNGPGHRLSDEELAQLRWAYQHLEHPSLAARLTSRLATPIEESLNLLPKTWRKRLDKATESSVCASLRLAIGSLANLETARANTWMPKFVAAGAGAAGGFLGPVTLLAELPVTTVLMLRAIADIARSEGEDLSQTDARLACVQVFALGGRTSDDDTADLGYYGLRVALGLYFERDILEFAANVQGPHIPAVIQMIRAISARFGVVISDKAAAQMVPVAGALSGAMLNLIFMTHYQDVARGHFIVRRLEREHGADLIREVYQGLRQEEAEAEKDFSPLEGW
jgi:hypothetical protein